jgi:hypothetical protein
LDITGAWSGRLGQHDVVVTITSTEWNMRIPNANFTDSGTYTRTGNVGTLRSNNNRGGTIGTATVQNETTLQLVLNNTTIAPGTFTLHKTRQQSAPTTSRFATKNPTHGYDAVRFGASVDEVRRAFSLGNNIRLEERHQNNPDIAILVEENVSESISSRIFMFNKWGSNGYRLYHVWVIYRDASENTVRGLNNLLVERFGHGVENDRGNIVFSQHSPELEVELIRTSETRIYSLDRNGNRVYENLEGRTGRDMSHFFTSGRHFMEEVHHLRIGYTWKEFHDEYRAQLSGLGL